MGRPVIMESSCPRIYSYVVRTDSGLAPNPFWGYCTLAVCTPNHQGIKARKGDWIVGWTSAERGPKLLYAMLLTEAGLCFDKYFKDSRFQDKKPLLSGDWMQRCGDNIYYLRDGKWKQLDSPFHHAEDIARDTGDKRHYVFISQDFYYFGREAVEVPGKFAAIVKRGRGCNGPEFFESSGLLPVCAQFVDWLRESDLDIHGDPFDREGDCCRRSSKSRCSVSRARNPRGVVRKKEGCCS